MKIALFKNTVYNTVKLAMLEDRVRG